jgi:hypothetical protein
MVKQTTLAYQGIYSCYKKKLLKLYQKFFLPFLVINHEHLGLMKKVIEHGILNFEKKTFSMTFLFFPENEKIRKVDQARGGLSSYIIPLISIHAQFLELSAFQLFNSHFTAVPRCSSQPTTAIGFLGQIDFHKKFLLHRNSENFQATFIIQFTSISFLSCTFFCSSSRFHATLIDSLG